MAGSKRRIEEPPENMSILEASDFWDGNSLLDFSDTQEVDLKEGDIRLEREVYYCPVSRGLMKRLQERALTEGVSPATLLNLYLQEKLSSAETPPGK